MSDERVNRLTQAVADLSENQIAQGRVMMRLLDRMSGELVAIRAELAGLSGAVRELAGEQVAFSRALRMTAAADG